MIQAEDRAPFHTVRSVSTRHRRNVLKIVPIAGRISMCKICTLQIVSSQKANERCT